MTWVLADGSRLVLTSHGLREWVEVRSEQARRIGLSEAAVESLRARYAGAERVA